MAKEKEKSTSLVGHTIPSVAYTSINMSVSPPTWTTTWGSSWATPIYLGNQDYWFTSGYDMLCACGQIATFRSPKDFCNICWATWFVDLQSHETNGQWSDAFNKTMVAIK